MKKKKNLSFRIKAVDDSGAAAGQFEAYASVFDVVDSYGEVVRKGAFKDDLAEWAKDDAPIPLLWGHDLFDMFNNIGGIVKAEEDDRGLKVQGEIDLSTPHGQQAYKLIKEKRVRDLSFAYDVLESGDAELEDGTKVVELKKLKTYEVSIVPIGANPETEFLAIKARVGDLIKKKDKENADLAGSVRDAWELLGTVLKAIEGGEDEKDGDPDDESADDKPDDGDDQSESDEGGEKSKERELRYRERLLDLI